MKQMVEMVHNSNVFFLFHCHFSMIYSSFILISSQSVLTTTLKRSFKDAKPTQRCKQVFCSQGNVYCKRGTFEGATAGHRYATPSRPSTASSKDSGATDRLAPTLLVRAKKLRLSAAYISGVGTKDHSGTSNANARPLRNTLHFCVPLLPHSMPPPDRFFFPSSRPRRPAGPPCHRARQLSAAVVFPRALFMLKIFSSLCGKRPQFKIPLLLLPPSVLFSSPPPPH